MLKIQIIHGPNLNRLGQREPENYGHTTLADLTKRLDQLAERLDITLNHYQSNHEGQIIDCIHQCTDDDTAGLIINPAAFTHTSVAIRDALAASDIPFIEVHISNVYAREPFRAHSYISDLASGSIVGMGVFGYELALLGLTEQLGHRREHLLLGHAKPEEH
ncbi:MAG TPA: type II 3-dehydroquinate dehydratase [Halothiobacillaceae bacterium]|nr:type II 3-dehydroquinate dehydratase [Halothiobacillaceae bacterium]